MWLKEGDHNTRFFHTMASKRKRNNMISRIKDGQGRWLEKDDKISITFMEYFNELYDNSHPHKMERIFQATKVRVNEEMNDSLLKEFTSMEVKLSLDQINSDKAPSLDGMTRGFYKKYWGIVG